VSDEQGGGGDLADAAATPPLKIFINYRREEASFPAHRLYEDLAERFGEEQVFIDVDTIEPGLPFDEVIEREVGSCDVLLVMIGPNWLELTDETGRRRLDKPDDYVRLEVEAALRRGVRVIPALLREASPPSSDQLPESLQRLARLQALPLSDDRRWREDVERLIRLLKKLQEVKAEAAEQAAHRQHVERGRAAREAAEQAANGQVETVDDQVSGSIAPAVLDERSTRPGRRWIVAGAAVLVAGGTAAGLGIALSGGDSGGTPAPRISPNLAAGKAAFGAQGCSACHALSAAGSTGTVGPDLDHLKTYAARASESLDLFIRESIVNPDGYSERGYPKGVMPRYGSLPRRTLDGLVAFLAASAKS
jgi:hypothetical protein